MVWQASGVGPSLVAALLLPLGRIFLLAAAACAVAAWVLSPPIRSARLHLTITFSLLAASYAMIEWQLPFRLRFAMSRQSLKAAAARPSRLWPQARHEPPLRVGWFYVKETSQVGDCYRYLTNSCGLDDCGLVFCSRGVPVRSGGEDSYVPLTPNKGWWQWYQGW